MIAVAWSAWHDKQIVLMRENLMQTEDIQG